MKNKGKIVVIESPLKGDNYLKIEENIQYAKDCLLDSLNRGESPFMSHLLYTQVLDDTNFNERKKGMQAGLRFYNVADKIIVYIDKGISQGMKIGIKKAKQMGKKIEYRKIKK